ncbi:MAG TPA: hypothetical protein VHR18_03955 [Solirubrobacterales bacterium]|jgi:hypothetical protein|nr:hypothetical protein [Solirubrobacterales bacterium]
MGDGERDSTDDWALPAEARPPTLAQLEQRIDHALAVARSSEAAALEIGAAALEAAEQARRAAELAERASGSGAPAGGSEVEATLAIEVEPAPDTGFDSLRHFTERADRVAARLRAMAPVP